MTKFGEASPLRNDVCELVDGASLLYFVAEEVGRNVQLYQ